MSLFTFLKEQWTALPYPEIKHTGQTIIVTGANTGLGLEAAKHFTRLNAEKVILACRSEKKGLAAKDTIEQATGRTGVVDVWELDLSNYDSVKQFAQKAQSLKRLDVLLNNAGIARDFYETIADNESHITVNVVSTFLLSLLMLPKLQESASKYNITPYLTTVNSEVHGHTKFPEKNSPEIFKMLNDKKAYVPAESYPKSKLVGVFYCRELAEKTKQSGKPMVIVNYLNPGLCHSELSRDSGFFLTVMKTLFARSTEVGSRTLVSGTTAGEACHGQYMSCCRIAAPAPLVTSEEGPKIQAQVFRELNQKLEAIAPGVTSNIN